MRLTKEHVFEILEQVITETRIPLEVNRLIADYYHFLQVSDILVGENSFFSLLNSEDLRITFQTIIGKYVAECRTVEIFRKPLRSELKAIEQKPTDDKSLKDLMMGLVKLDNHREPFGFAEFIRSYEERLPHLTAKIREFAQDILTFFQFHIAISCSKDQIDFLFRLIKQYCALPNMVLNLSHRPLKPLPTVMESNGFCDKILSLYFEEKEPIELRNERFALRNGKGHALLPSPDFLIFKNINGYIIYIDRNNQFAINELTKELPKQMAEWKAYQEQDLSTSLLNTNLPLKILDIIIEYHSRPPIGNLLAILPQCRDFLSEKIVNDYTRLLTAKKNQDPFLHAEEIKTGYNQLSVVANPITALAQQVKESLPNTKPLLDYFLSIRGALSMSNAAHYKVIIELIEGLLLHAETHVCIYLNDAFYAKISNLTQKALTKLDEKSSLEQQDQFQNQLNTLFSSKKIPPISFVVVQNEETRLYVEADASEVISCLESLTQSQDIFSSSSCSSSFMFNKPQLLAPDKTSSLSEERTLSLL